MSNLQINERIALLRKGKGITQEELAQELGVTNQSVSKWESAQCCPDIQLLPDIADFFGVTVDSLFNHATSSELTSAELPWEDDDTLHVVVYRGHEILKRDDGDLSDIHFVLEGDAANVVCYCGMECGNILNGIEAQGDVICRGDINGDVSANGDVTCEGSVSGDVSINGDLTCKGSVGGDVSINGDLVCNGSIDGDVSVGGDLTCRHSISGSVSCGGDLTCYGNVSVVENEDDEDDEDEEEEEEDKEEEEEDEEEEDEEEEEEDEEEEEEA